MALNASASKSTDVNIVTLGQCHHHGCLFDTDEIHVLAQCKGRDDGVSGLVPTARGAGLRLLASAGMHVAQHLPQHGPELALTAPLAPKSSDGASAPLAAEAAEADLLRNYRARAASATTGNATSLSSSPSAVDCAASDAPPSKPAILNITNHALPNPISIRNYLMSIRISEDRHYLIISELYHVFGADHCANQLRCVLWLLGHDSCLVRYLTTSAHDGCTPVYRNDAMRADLVVLNHGKGRKRYGERGRCAHLLENVRNHLDVLTRSTVDTH